MTHKEILNKAADLLEQHGIIAGNRGGPHEGFCALGALAYASNGTVFGVDVSLCQIIVDTLGLEAQYDPYNLGRRDEPDSKIAAWSNNLADDDRGYEVIAGLRQVAASL